MLCSCFIETREAGPGHGSENEAFIYGNIPYGCLFNKNILLYAKLTSKMEPKILNNLQLDFKYL